MLSVHFLIGFSLDFFQVTGVVGRAETLSSVFYLAAFIFYTKATRRKKSTGMCLCFAKKETFLYIFISSYSVT
jgi:hypothetical protein